ncbi:ANTAR domain-containing protein, partial [Nocardia farcinica]|uniref:ANTAR domain-containing protein n=1 Tax=Nocardia farcinica TaxID=37329 RepID=UPI002457BB9F
RSKIDQAIGVLCVVYGIWADESFWVLCWRSQESNVKLLVLEATPGGPPAAAGLPAGALMTKHHPRVIDYGAPACLTYCPLT